jgi:hypothetical protein
MRSTSARLFGAVAMLWVGVSAFAATGYTVRRGTTGLLGGTYTVVAEPDRIRATSATTPDGPILYDSVLWIKGSPTIALNSQMQTWYTVARPFALSASYLSAASMAKRIKQLAFTFEEVAGAPDGEHRYSGRLRFVVLGAYNVTYTATMDVTTTDAVDPRLWLTGMLPLTGMLQIDEKIAAAEATIKGFPLRMSITATRQYAGGGALMTAVNTVEVSDIRQTEAKDALFVQPAHYRYEKPVFAAPAK